MTLVPEPVYTISRSESKPIILPARARYASLDLPMSNIERLQQAGIVNPDALSDLQKDFLNKDLTTEDVEDLLKVGQKAQDYGKRGGETLTFTWGV
jgi:hypothetical protein